MYINKLPTIHQKSTMDYPSGTWCPLFQSSYINQTKVTIFCSVYKYIAQTKGTILCDVYKYRNSKIVTIFCGVYKSINPTIWTIFCDIYKSIAKNPPTLLNLRDWLESNQFIDYDRFNCKNRNPIYDLTQAYVGIKYVCPVLIWSTEDFQLHLRISFSIN